MASLNTLRTRGGVIVSVVIGIALFAFLLGDYTSSGGDYMNSNSMEVGEINGTQIGYLEYSNTGEDFTNIVKLMSGKEVLSTEEQQQAQNMGWESLILKYSYQPGFSDLGISLENDEIVDMINGAYRSPVITNFFTDPQTGSFNPILIKNFLYNLDKDPSGNTTLIWQYLKGEMSKEREMSKYMNLIAKGSYVTDIEVAHNVATAKNTYSARYVSQDYTTIADSTINVSNSDIKSYYANHENIFKQGESRDIEYVVFDLLPSMTDYEDAAVYVKQIADEFVANENPMQYATLNSQSQVDTKFYKESELDAKIAEKLYDNADAVYGPVLNGDKYTISRLSSMKELPDSLGAKHILLASTDQKLADSLITVLKKGGDFAELSEQFSTDETAVKDGGDIGVFAPDRMIPEFSDACIAEKVGSIFSVTTNFGIHVVELTKKTPNIAKAQIATITYEVEPSDETQQLVYGEASNFIASAAGSYDSFRNAATESALSKRVARIRNTDRQISGLDQSREIIRWAFNEENGAVSDIMEVDGDYLVAALTSISEDDIMPISQATGQIRNILTREKKAELIKAKMASITSLDAAATSIDSKVKDIKDLTFNSYYIEEVGVEPKLVGAICGGANEKTLSKPVIGTSGVFLFNINKVTANKDITAESERELLEVNTQNFLSERVNMALIEGSELIDMRIKFF